MHFTNKVLTVLAASLLAATATAAPKCHVGTAWPDPHDCHKFFECAAGGIPVRKSCGPGTAYSPRLKICDYEENVPSCHRGKPDWKPHWSTDDKGKDKGKGKDEWPKNKYEQEKRQDLHTGWEHEDEQKHKHPYPHRPWWNEQSEDHHPRPEWPGYGYYNGEETTDETTEGTTEETTEETTAESTGETTGETNEDTAEDTTEVASKDTSEDTSEETNETN